jgi:hypothetical protein
MTDKIDQATQNMIKNLETMTGKTMAEWIAIVQPTTKTRIDVGLVLKGVEPGGRLEKAGSWNAMCTHRVRVESTEEIDEELLGWLKAAYDGA